MIFLSVSSTTLVFFDHSGDIILINILMSGRVEPTNAACAPSTAAFDALNHYTTLYGVYCSAWRRYIRYLSNVLGGCLVGVMVFIILV